MVQENIVILLKDIHCMKGENFTFSLLLMTKGVLLKLLLDGWVGRVGMPSKSFSTYHSWFSRSGIKQ